MLKTWTEYVSRSLLTRTDTICPDKNCQKVVDQDLAAKREKRDALINKRAQEKAERAKLQGP